MSDSTEPKTASGSALLLQGLIVRRMYGRAFDLDVSDLSADVNVITGPNGSGKTTLARSVAATLWPKAQENGSVMLEGQFHLNGDSWRADVDGSRIEYQKDGIPEPLPDIPPPGHQERYHLYLHDLLPANDHSEKELVQTILQEAQGGYDISTAADNLGFGNHAKATLKETRELREAKDRVREAQENQSDLYADQQSLGRLKEELKEAKAAERRRDALNQALIVKEEEENLQQAESALQTFPEDMNKVRGGEDERLADLREERKNQTEEKNKAKDEIEEAEERITDNLLPEDGLPDGTLQRIQAAVDDWAESQKHLERIKREKAQAEVKEEKERERLDVDDLDQASRIDLPDLDELESLVGKRLNVEAQEKEIQALKRLFGDAEPQQEPDALRRATERLEEWLREPDPDWTIKAKDTTTQRIGYGLAVATIVVGGGIAVGGYMIGGILCAVLGAALVFSLYQLTGKVEIQSGRSDLQDRFNAMNVRPPKSWSSEDVRQRLDALVSDWTKAKLETVKQEEWERHASREEDVQDEQEKLNERRGEIIGALGIQPGKVGEYSLLWFVKRLSAWQSAHTNLQGKKAEADEAEKQVHGHREAVRKLVTPYDIDDVATVSSGHAALDQLRDANQELLEACGDRKSANQTLNQATSRIRDIDEEITGIFERLNLPEGNDDDVVRRCKKLDDYTEADRKVDLAQQAVNRERKRLQNMSGFEERMLSAVEADLIQEKRDAQSLSEEVDELADKISRIQQRVEDARKNHDLEEAQADLRTARRNLDRRRQSDVESVVGKALAKVVHQRTRNQDLPEVFDRADEIFRQITRDRYRLDLRREEEAFRVVNSDGHGLDLNQLSSGTKVQLLLAVRIAFVETQEQDVKLPLVLDETLANSDDGKALAIIDAIQTICQQGRQVFYLTAQSDEVAKWRSALADTETDLVVCTLSNSQPTEKLGPDDFGGDGSLRSGRPSQPDLPDPDSVAHDDLNDLLEVSTWTPRTPVGHLHLWYLTNDTALLCRAVESGYHTWGQVERLAERNGLPIIGMEGSTYERLKALAKAVSNWAEAWQVGRGRPVDRAVLEDTDAISNKKLDEVADLVEASEGSAEKVIKGLRDGAVPYFRENKTTELENYFYQHGYLTNQDPLDSESCWRRATTSVSDDVSDGRITLDSLETVLDRICAEAEELDAKPEGRLQDE